MISPLSAVADSNTSRPRFSVIVPVLNGARWLPDTLAAIESQTFPAEATEVLFIDNGSTDDSVEILSRHPRVRVFHEPRHDPYLARNRGIEAAGGEYLVFLDADCPPHVDWLAEFDQSINQAPADVLVGTLLHPAKSPLMLKCYEAYYNTKIAWLFAHGRTANFFGHAGNMVIRCDIFTDIGLFEAMPIVGDTEIIHRLLHSRADAVVRFVPRARVVHAEVDSVGALMAKLYAIGIYTQNLVPRGGYRPVSLQDKVCIAANSIRSLPLGLLGVFPLVTVLGCGWAVYLSGRLTATLNALTARRDA
jgi:glycosyltransferase involved in cell wall biosynthesis